MDIPDKIDLIKGKRNKKIHDKKIPSRTILVKERNTAILENYLIENIVLVV